MNRAAALRDGVKQAYSFIAAHPQDAATFSHRTRLSGRFRLLVASARYAASHVGSSVLRHLECEPVCRYTRRGHRT